nr:thaumatin-like protein 1 [Ipomoea batatas]
MSSAFTFATTIAIILAIVEGVFGASLTFINRCDYTVWPGILANAGSERLESTGFELGPGGSREFHAPASWSGRIWGRTGCSFDDSTGQGSCATGDCGSSQVECNGAGATPPATLAEFTIKSGGQDFYDVSLVDGYNLPMQVEAVGGSGACGSTGCAKDLNRMCPEELRAGDGQACKSACRAFGTPEYCCSGAYGSPATCKPSMYSEMFKTACPRSYSYAYDDATSTFTCSGADYKITFCPSLTSRKSSLLPSFSTGVAGNEDSGPEDSMFSGRSWLPGFLTGDSSRMTSQFGLHSKSPITSAIAFFILLLIHSLQLFLL